MTSDCIIKTTDYCGNLIYEQGRPKMMLVDGGYVTFNDNANSNDSLSFGEGWGGASYHYYLTDHLGNNRVVVNSNDSIEQVNHYYPYGGLMAESTGGDTQRYKYNGKELDRMHGLDWYDYGARWMNGLTFTTPDPKAWDYTDVSPYVYCMNNPIKFVDPDGRKIVNTNGKNAVIYKNGEFSYTSSATEGIKRVVNSLMMSNEGIRILKQALASDISIKIVLSPVSKVSGSRYTYGETIQGNYDPKDNYGKYVNKDGTYSIKEATVTIYEGTIIEDGKTANPKHAGLSTDEAIGAVAGHELVHASDKEEIHKDINYELAHKGRARREREEKPEKVESKIMEQILMKKKH